MSDVQDLDLSSYTIAELEAFAKRIGQEIARKHARLRRRVPAIVERGGPVYRNPANSSETWSGRGEPPAWFRRLIGAGHRAQSLIS